MRLSLHVGALSLLGLASACAVGPDFETPAAPSVATYSAPGEINTVVQLAPSAETPSAWWQAFHSEELDTLLNEAFANNLTLAQADANLSQARAAAAATRGGLLPSLDTSASAQRERINIQSFGFTGFPNPTISLYSVGASVGYDLDLFGGRRRAVERDDARVAADQARIDAAYLTLSGNVVQAAVQIAGDRAKLNAQRDIVAADERMQDMVRRAIEAGGQPRAAVTTTNAQLAEDQALLPQLEQNLAQSRHRLALLLGRTPANTPDIELDLDALRTPSSIPISLPSELVRRRPDIRAAEAELHAATADIGVETAALYPYIGLSASLTQSAIDPEAVFEATSAAWSLGANATAPIFHGGTLRANVQRANAEQRAALATYQQTVLEAFVQVADLMQAVSNDSDRIAAEQHAVDAATANANNAQISYDAGASSLLSLLDAQRQVSRAHLSLIDARVAQLNNTAALYVAAAADWTRTPP